MANIVSIDPANALSFTQAGGPNSSFGPEEGTFGTGFRGRTIFNGDRYQDLERRASYYRCTQHDARTFDFDGRVYNPRSTMPLIGAEKAHWYVPLRMRRPSAPYRLARIIVDAFTALLFGENRFPTIRVDGDGKSEDFMQTLARVGRLPQKMIQLRNLGGSTGSVGMSWCYYQGKPRFEAHDAKNLHVHSWEDRVALIPRHVSEVYLFYRVLWDGKGFNKTYFWFRRDWTPNWDIVFQDVPYQQGQDPYWIPDLNKSVKHGDGRTHFEWIQNLPTDEEDGLPDYDGLYDQMDTLDVLCSVVTRGATLNLDPTLKLKLDPDLVERKGIRKGSDNALIVGENGDADYLELEGTSIEAGLKLIEMKRRAILEAAQCVVTNPDEVAAQGTSSVAMKMMYAPMIAKGDVLREQYGAPMERALDAMTEIARGVTKSRVIITDEETGEQKEGQLVIVLPPKVEEIPEEEDESESPPPVDPPDPNDPRLDPTHPAYDPSSVAAEQKAKADAASAEDESEGASEGESEGSSDEPSEPKIKKTQREPGEGGEINLRWPPYFPPTPTDQTAIVTNMQNATGGEAFLSNETATEIAAGAFGIDPAEEKRKLQAEKKKTDKDKSDMFPPAGGGVNQMHQLPPGARPKPPKPGAPPSFSSKGKPPSPKGGNGDEEGVGGMPEADEV